jgi:hypothetical protein
VATHSRGYDNIVESTPSYPVTVIVTVAVTESQQQYIRERYMSYGFSEPEPEPEFVSLTFQKPESPQVW